MADRTVRICDLKESDKGRKVLYRDGSSHRQYGTISSWDEQYVLVDFVVYVPCLVE